jgi:hypothetical protein
LLDFIRKDFVCPRARARNVPVGLCRIFPLPDRRDAYPTLGEISPKEFAPFIG